MSASRRDPSVGALILITLAGQLIAAGLAMLLARRLSSSEFEAYAVAAAVFMLMLAVAPLGTDKLALRLLPPLVANGDAAGFAPMCASRSAVPCLGRPPR